jgi:hypothetical protein
MAYKHGKELPKKGDDAVDALRYVLYYLYSSGLLRLNENAPEPPPAKDEEDEVIFLSPSVIVAERIKQRREGERGRIGYGKWNFFGGDGRL